LNLTGRGPLGLKAEKPKKDPKHLARLREQPCIVCKTHGEPQNSPTQAHHCVHDRHSARKVSDALAIPLCEGHHQGLWDQTKLALHKAPKQWRETYGPDWSYVQEIEIDK
jgi:hypothetical protein